MYVLQIIIIILWTIAGLTSFIWLAIETSYNQEVLGRKMLNAWMLWLWVMTILWLGATMIELILRSN